MIAIHHGPRIISVSRRTDIPAFYTPWLLGRLEAGFADYWHPFGHRWYRVSLRPQDVIGIVFWSKNFGPLIPHLREIARSGYCFYCEFTITGLPAELERRVPPTEQAVEQLRTISRTLSPDHVHWRFDPIVVQQSAVGAGPRARPPPVGAALRGRPLPFCPHPSAIGPQQTTARFRLLCDHLAGFTRCCTISFMRPYAKVRRNLGKAAIPFIEPPLDLKRELAFELARIATEYGMRLYSCADDSLVGPDLLPPSPGIPLPSPHSPRPTSNVPRPTSHVQRPTLHTPRPLRGHCIGLEKLLAVGADVPKTAREAPVTPDCGCLAAIDIGAYDTCAHGCVYCYANTDQSAGVRGKTGTRQGQDRDETTPHAPRPTSYFLREGSPCAQGGERIRRKDFTASRARTGS